ncbi:MAG: ABC transporter permease [Oscillospiraceae bacterium]
MDMLLSLLSMTVKMSTPYLLCVIGGVYPQRAGVFNIALDGVMNFGAFAGILFTVIGSNLYFGSFMGVVMSVLIILVFALFTIKLQANAIIVGIAINFLTSALPRFIMESFYGSRGSLIATDYISPLSMKLDVPILRSIPILSDIFNGQTPLTYFSFVCVVVLTVVLYKTKFGIYTRVTGENGEAARAIGIKTDSIKLIALLISAVTCGLAGLNLSVESLGMYTADMSASRGFICLSAIVCGRREPIRSSLYALLFGFARALQVFLTTVVDSVTASLIGIIPYITILV